MIKFYRKIRQNLISEGKTVKYFKYAIGEIVLVVIGILIALGINNWNDAQKMTRKEIKVYQEIHSELNETLAGVLDDKKDWEEILNASVKIRDMLVKNDVNKDSLLRYLPRTWDLEQSNPKTSAFESLKSLGLDILSNDTLRQDITTLYQLTIPSLMKSDAAVEAGRIRIKVYSLLEPHLKMNRTEILSLLARNEGTYIRSGYFDIKDVESLIDDEPLLLTIQESLNWRLKVIRIHEWVVKSINSVMLHIEDEIERLS